MTLITIVQPCSPGDEIVKQVSSSDSDYAFHPISPNSDQCGLSCISTDASSQVTHDTPDDDMDLTPYPFATTEEELDEWERLELSCGKDWSLQLASQLLDVARLPGCGDDDDSSTIMSDEASFCEEVEGICDMTSKEDFWERHADHSMFAMLSN
jgi:hypothetical protein